MNKSPVPLAFLLCLACLVLHSSSQFTNPGCASFDSNLICISCLNSYYMIGSICLPVSPLCVTYNSTTGACLTCYNGFMLSNGVCSLIPAIPNCLQYSQINGSCTQCKSNFYLSLSVCKAVSSTCSTYDPQTGSCLSCITSYTLRSGVCLIAAIQNCQNQLVSTCLQCLPEYLLLNNNCYIMDINCQNYSSTLCNNCMLGYILSTNNNITTNPTQCYPIIQYCSLYDTIGNCIGCAIGFNLTTTSNTITCILVGISVDPFCSIFNGITCIRCSFGFYFSPNNSCTQVSTLCQTYNSTTGDCLSCYNGYLLNGTACILNNGYYDPNCNAFNGTKCIKCSKGSHFDVNGTCINADQNCQNYNPNNICVSCYSGYMIDPSSGVCLLDTSNCNTYSNSKCIKCSYGYYLNTTSNTCIQIDPLCAKFDYNLFTCTNCYMGYALYQGSCKLPQDIPSNIVSNVNCASFNSKNLCTKCYFRYYLDSKSICQQVNTLCKTFDTNTGKCLSCYTGYFYYAIDGVCLKVN